MLSGRHSISTKPLLVLLPVAALIAILPLILHGTSCGQDQVFHIESWLDAAAQLRQLHYPHWASSAAWNAGEPRFVFYPPLSWLLGALLTTIFPVGACPTIFIFLVLLTSGFTFYRLASAFASPNAAVLASAFYLANPYMLFCAFERSAYAELLAAAWIPLLLLAVLRARPTIRSVAIALALLWLTNAPAAVIGSYSLALLAVLRLGYSFILPRHNSAPPMRLAITYVAGTILGLALPAYYLVPAAYERRYVQVAMAIIPNMRFQDNFLFTRTTDAAHNAVNLTASLLALTLLVLTAACFAVLLLRRSAEGPATRTLLRYFAPTVALIVLLLTPLSTPLWKYLPELAFLQFPWRLLTVVAPILAMSLALVFERLSKKLWAVATATLLLPLVLTLVCFHLYTQECDPHDTPSNIAMLLRSGHGLGPTDEYTPSSADNDLLRSNDPAFWVFPTNANPNTPALHTTPTADELNPNLDTDDVPIPVTQTLSTPVPHHFDVQAEVPAMLVLHLRDYPAWTVTRAGGHGGSQQVPEHINRDDGLIALPLPAGSSTIDITWHRTPDQTIGLLLSGLALLALAILSGRRKTQYVARP